MASSPGQTSSEDEDQSGTIQLFVVRHSQSLNNLVLKYVPFMYPCWASPDPSLSMIGSRAAKRRGNELHELPKGYFHLVACSEMVRTMQTSNLMFKKSGVYEQPIYVVPHVSELPVGCCCRGCCKLSENVPTAREHQLQRIDFEPDFRLVGGEEGENTDVFLRPPDFEDFLQWLASSDEGKQLMDIARQNRINPTDPLRIVLVTHSNLMKKRILDLKSKPNNVDVYRMHIKLSLSGRRFEPVGPGERITNLGTMESTPAEIVSDEKKQKRANKVTKKKGEHHERLQEKAHKEDEKVMKKVRKEQEKSSE